MTKPVITAQCVAIVTAIEGVEGKAETSAIININGNTIKHLLADGQPHQFTVGKSYEVSFSPVAEESKTESAPSTETPDAPVSEGQSEEQAESDEPMKEAA